MKKKNRTNNNKNKNKKTRKEMKKKKTGDAARGREVGVGGDDIAADSIYRIVCKNAALRR